MRCKSLKIGLGFEEMVAVLNVTDEMGLFMKIKKKKKRKAKEKGKNASEKEREPLTKEYN